MACMVMLRRARGSRPDVRTLAHAGVGTRAQPYVGQQHHRRSCRGGRCEPARTLVGQAASQGATAPRRRLPPRSPARARFRSGPAAVCRPHRPGDRCGLEAKVRTSGTRKGVLGPGGVGVTRYASPCERKPRYRPAYRHLPDRTWSSRGTHRSVGGDLGQRVRPGVPTFVMHRVERTLDQPVSSLRHGRRRVV